MLQQTMLIVRTLRFSVALPCLAVLLLLAPARPVAAQGTMGAVPDPISSRELEGYADRLGLSPQQRQAIESLHDQYRAEFAQLRERDIEKFINDNQSLGGGGPMGAMGMLTDRKAVEKALRDLEDIHSKIRSIDNRLFDQMQEVLTEEQLAKLPQAKQARERVRYRSGLNRLAAFLNPAAQVDLSELISDINLSSQEKQAAEPVISQYESSLTAGARRLFEATNNMITDGLDAMQKQIGAELTEDIMRNPEMRGRMFQAMRTVMGELQRKLAAKSGELSDLNRRTLRTVSPLLSQEHARSLRDQFYNRAYPEISGGRGARTASRAFDVVSKFKDPGLSDEQREALATVSTEYFNSLDRLAEQAMDAIDENRKTQTFFDFNDESRRRFQDQLASLREKRDALNDSTMNSLRAMLSPEMIERLDKRLAERGDAPEVEAEAMIAISAAGAPGIAGAVSVTRIESAGGDDESGATISPYIPGPISKRDLDVYAEQLNLSAEDRVVLTSIHTDYMEKFTAVEGNEIKGARDAERTLWQADPATGQIQTRSPQAIDDLYALRAKATRAITALDEQFFGDLGITLGDEDAPTVQRLLSARKRQVYLRAGGGAASFFGGMSTGRPDRDNRGEGRDGRRGPGGDRGGAAVRMFGPGMGGGEASVDLAAVATGMQKAASNPTEFDSVLSEYEQAALAAFQKLYEANLRMAAARDKMMAQSIRRDGDRETRTVQIGDGMRGLMENEGRAAREARNAVAALNKSTLPRLMSALPSGEAQILRRSYYQKAFPSIFNDSNSAEPHLNGALKLPTLTDQQRSAIQELALEYRGQYDDLSEKLIAMEESGPDLADLPFGGRGGREGGNWQDFQERMRTREKIEFDRKDLNDKTVTRLSGVLTEQQLRELGLERDRTN